jgi:hypothetical protein
MNSFFASVVLRRRLSTGEDIFIPVASKIRYENLTAFRSPGNLLILGVYISAPFLPCTCRVCALDQISGLRSGPARLHHIFGGIVRVNAL